jgi:hypothetical protein
VEAAKTAPPNSLQAGVVLERALHHLWTFVTCLPHDDCIGRYLDQLFRSDWGSLASAAACHAVSEFGVELE